MANRNKNEISSIESFKLMKPYGKIQLLEGETEERTLNQHKGEKRKEGKKERATIIIKSLGTKQRNKKNYYYKLNHSTQTHELVASKINKYVNYRRKVLSLRSLKQKPIRM